MREQRCKFRVLGLSATPGSDGAKVQASAPWRCCCCQLCLRLLQAPTAAECAHCQTVKRGDVGNLPD
jgi:ribosomal protein L36